MALSPRQITRALDRVLHKVEQPARYTGGELNSIAKDWADPSIRTKVALAFPDIYELGGSNLGLQVLYDRINRRPDDIKQLRKARLDRGNIFTVGPVQDAMPRHAKAEASIGHAGSGRSRDFRHGACE